jgi:hypothetical protein
MGRRSLATDRRRQGAAPAAAPVFDPTASALTGLYRGSFGGDPWAGTASAGTSGGRSLSAGAAPAVGAAVNGFTPASFNGTTHFLTDLTNTADTYLTTTAYRVSLLLQPAALAAPSGLPYNDPGLITESGGNWGITVDSAGVHVYHHDGVYKIADGPAALLVGTWYAVDVVYNGTDITVSVNGTAGTPVAAGTLGTIAGAGLRMGSNYAATVFYSGLILDAALANTTLAGSTHANFRAYYASRYGVSV